jgi:hypothetical protein
MTKDYYKRPNLIASTLIVATIGYSTVCFSFKKALLITQVLLIFFSSKILAFNPTRIPFEKLSLLGDFSKYVVKNYPGVFKTG